MDESKAEQVESNETENAVMIGKPTVVLKALRAFDGILFSSIAGVVILFYPNLAFDLLGNMRLLAVVPVLAFAWFCLSMPPGTLGARRALPLGKLRIAALATAGLAPLFVWWTQQMDDIYLFINALVCLVAGSTCLMMLSQISRELCLMFDQNSLAWEAKLTYNLIFWLQIVVTWGGLAALVLLAGFLGGGSPQTIMNDLMGYGTYRGYLPILGIRAALLLTVMGPTVFYMSLVFRIRLVLSRNLHIAERGCT